MKLTVHERVALGSILPAEGDFATLKVQKNLRMALSFSEAEFKKWSIVESDGRMSWKLVNEKGKPIPQEAEIEIGEKANDIIVLALSKLNEQKKLPEQAYTLYEKFIENGRKEG